MTLKPQAAELHLFDTLRRETVSFTPIAPPFVGMYVCGPTVYGYPHLGHARGPVVFDVLVRYLRHLGYRVRYVRNITDVGHLVGDADEGEDKIAQKARLEKLEPMEIAHYFSLQYHHELGKMNLLPPSIEPLASGHIPEQINMVKKLLAEGLAYESNGSVYFDVPKYAQAHPYGALSGRVLDELIAGAADRELERQAEKRHPADFALWKKAAPEHIMQWESPWGMGFPGWHLECSAMSGKYLGEQFDIHGGGMDLIFPHHEAEIAQSTGCNHVSPARYWLHHNMVTINGQKMAKSLNNGILLKDFFTGSHPLMDKAYSPMTLKFFILQAHYRGTLDFSTEALTASEKGLQRLMNAIKAAENLPVSGESSFDVSQLENEAYAALNEDLNTPILIATLFEAARLTFLVKDRKEHLSTEGIQALKQFYQTFAFDILGLRAEAEIAGTKTDELMSLIIQLRNGARANKDYKTSDTIRDTLAAAGIILKDGKDGTTYEIH